MRFFGVELMFGSIRQGIMTEKGIMFEEFRYYFSSMMKLKVYGVAFSNRFLGYIRRIE